MEFLNNCKIGERFARMRLDRFLSQEYSYLSRSEWQKEIRRGKISFNGTVSTRIDKRVRSGDIISYAGRDAPEPAVCGDYSIIYEDDFILGVDKPANLPVHPAGIFYHNTLLSFLQKRYPQKLHLIHRLDRETSGVVILAKNPIIAAELHKNFRTVKKTYLALVRGVPERREFTVDVPIAADPRSGPEHRRIARRDAGQDARTLFTRLFSFNGTSLLKAVPFTGRQHQIRVHLLYAGFPILGDKVYGAVRDKFLDFVKNQIPDELVRALGFQRSALHSRSIAFHHPGLGKKICIKAPLAADMRNFIQNGRDADV